MNNNIFLPMTEKKYKEFLTPYIESLTAIEISHKSVYKFNDDSLVWNVQFLQRNAAILILIDLFKEMCDKIIGGEELTVAHYSYPDNKGFSISNNKTIISLGEIEVQSEKSLYDQCMDVFNNFITAVQDLRDKNSKERGNKNEDENR